MRKQKATSHKHNVLTKRLVEEHGDNYDPLKRYAVPLPILTKEDIERESASNEVGDILFVNDRVKIQNEGMVIDGPYHDLLDNLFDSPIKKWGGPPVVRA